MNAATLILGVFLIFLLASILYVPVWRRIKRAPLDLIERERLP